MQVRVLCCGPHVYCTFASISHMRQSAYMWLIPYCCYQGGRLAASLLYNAVHTKCTGTMKGSFCMYTIEPPFMCLDVKAMGATWAQPPGSQASPEAGVTKRDHPSSP
jgi:hypothetical protein